MQASEQEQEFGPKPVDTGYQPSGGILFSDITGLVALVQSCFENITAAYRKAQIQKILASADWYEHHRDSKTGRRVLSHTAALEHAHEKTTAILLTQVNYDVIFVPKAMFKRSEKRYDVLLLRDTVILQADLKCIFSKNPDTIANRIREGSDQASRVVLHICSGVTPKILIQGLRSGCYKNSLLKGILLFYEARFYLLDKTLITSKRIFDIIK